MKLEAAVAFHKMFICYRRSYMNAPKTKSPVIALHKSLVAALHDLVHTYLQNTRGLCRKVGVSFALPIGTCVAAHSQLINVHNQSATT